MFKTLYSRYGNVKAGKFVAGAGDESNGEEFEALNDIEKVLNKIGISMRDTSAEFRNFDDVLAEIAEKWVTLTDVERNAISTAFAGTRQREVFNVLMNNYDEVGKFENIAENSEGSTKAKMDIYGDSVEASKNRLTATVEEWTLNFNILGATGDDILKGWNNSLTYILKNVKQLLAIAAALTVLFKGGSILLGAKNLGQSLAVSLNNWGTKFNKGAISGTFGVGSAALQQVQAQLGQIIYSTAMKLGMKMGLGDGIQLDRGASFLGGMSQKELAAWGKLDEKTQKAMIELYGAEGTELQLIAALEDLTLAIRGETDKVSSKNSADQKQSTEIKDKNGNVIGHTAAKSLDDAADNFELKVEDAAEFDMESTMEGSKFRTVADKLAAANEISTAAQEANIEISAGLAAAAAELQAEASAAGIELNSELAARAIKLQSEMLAAGIELNAEQAAAAIEVLSAIQKLGLQRGDAGMVVGMSNSKPVKGEMQKGGNMSNMSGALTAAGGMGATMIASMWNSKVTDTNDTTESTVATVSNMAPMIGSMFGPWGLLAGSLVSIAGSIFNTINKTLAELLAEALEQSKLLEDVKKDIEEDKKELETLESSETRFNELIKGINQSTGENISLNDSEWLEYLEILTNIINSRSDLYASYNAEGDLIARNKEGTIALNDAMAESIKLQELKLRLEYREAANTKDDDGKYAIAGDIYLDVLDTYVSNYGKLSDNFEVIPAGAGDEGFRSDIHKEIWEKYGLWDDIEYNSTNYSYNNFFDKLLKAGASADELYSVFKNNMQNVTQEQFTNKYSSIVHQVQANNNATRQALTSSLKSAMTTVLKGDENFAGLSEDAQSFMQNVVFGNIAANPYKNMDQTQGIKDNFDSMYAAYKEIAENAAKWGKDNVAGMQFLSTYDSSKATAKDDEQYQKYMLDMLQSSGADANKTRAILKGMGYTGFKGLIDEDGNWIGGEDGVLDEDGNLDLKKLQKKLKSKRERSVDVIKNTKIEQDDGSKKKLIQGNRKLEDDTDILDNLTNEEINALATNTSNEDIQKILGDTEMKAEDKLARIRFELKKIIMGDFASASEYLSVFSSLMNININNAEELAKALDESSNSSVFGFWQLKKVAANFGVEIKDLIKNIAILGDIDIFGRTSKSLPDITAQFELIDKAVSDLRENGKITAENLDALLTLMPELVHYVGQTYNGLSLQDVLESSASFKSSKYMASIENILATSDEKFQELVNQFITTDSSNDNVQRGTDVIKDATLMFGNLDTMQKTLYQMYEVDENGKVRTDSNRNVIVKDKYKDMALRAGEVGGYANDSWAKFIAENVFDIDTTKGTKKVNEELYNALKTRALEIDPNAKIKDFGSGGLTLLLQLFQQNLLGNTNYMYASQMAMEALSEINAALQVLDMEDEMKAEAVSKYMSDLDDAYSRGTISLETYEKSLSSITEASGASAELLKELKEKLEDLKFDELSKLFEKGAISGAKYRQELESLMSQNVMGSDDWKLFAEAYIGTYQQDIENLEKQFEFLQDDDYAGLTSLILSKQLVYGQKLAAIEAAGRAQYGVAYNREDDPEWLAAKSELMNSFKQLSEVLDTQYSDLKSNYDNGYIGVDDYIRSLTDLTNSTDASKEQIEAWTEELEDATLKLAEMNFNEGTLSGEDYRKTLAEQMHNNDKTSDDYIGAKDKYIASYDTEMLMELSRRALLDEHDYEGQIQSLENESLISLQKLAALTAAGLENSKEYTDELKNLVDLEKQKLEAQKQSYELNKQNAEEVLDAYSNILSYGIDELQNRQQDINDMYDDEISKLQDINDLKKRSIELTKLLQELENARKEKTRVYQAGIGWTYQENKAKVKQAKQNLEDYLDQRKIEDLQFAQKQLNKLIQDQIDRLLDIQDYISDIKTVASTTASLMDLKKNGIVPLDATISDAINQITKEAVNGPDGKVASLSSDFEKYKTEFTNYSIKLAAFEDDYPNKIKDLAGWAKTYKSDEALVNKLKEDFASTVKPLTDDIPTIEDKLTKFLGDKDYAGWTTDLATKIANALPKEENVEGIKSTDLTEVVTALNNAKLKLEEANRLMTLYASARATTTDGTWGSKGLHHNEYGKPKESTDGTTWYTFYNTENDPEKEGTPLYTLTYGKPGTYVAEDVLYWTQQLLEDMGYTFSTGIENGPVTYTGLAMLHGSPSSPEYVLNSDQAGTLLKNLATMTMSPYQAPKVDSYNHSASSTVYQFNGDMNLPNVLRPDQFFDELLKQANVQFPTIKENYR